MSRIDLSVVVPCYNEKDNIPLIVQRFRDVLPAHLRAELILVDNGSTDGSLAVMRQSRHHSFLRIVRVETNRGYGHGIAAGLRAAQGKYVCWTHADLQTDVKDTITAYYTIIKQPYPQHCFVKGQRAGRPLGDLFFTYGMSVFVSALLRTAFHDINAQPNLFHRQFLHAANSPPADFSFDLYFNYIAKKSGYRVVRFPVLFGPRLHGASSWNRGLRSKWAFIQRTMRFTLSLRRLLKGEKISRTIR